MRGRPPKPNVIKIAEGNPSKRPIRAEPTPTRGEPGMPSELDDEARAEWRRIVPELMAVGVLTVVDRGVLANYCMAWSRWLKAEKEIATGGITVSTEHGLRKHPAISVAEGAQRIMLAFLQQFGLSPVSRARLTTTRVDEKSDLEKFLA